MTSTGQARRRYDSSGRRAQADAARERILDAARTLFLQHGFAGTSVAAIAAAAGVSAPTVFSGFGSKVALLQRCVETALVGDDEPVPLHERPGMQHVHAGATAEEVVSRLATLIATTGHEVSPIAAVMYAAADADPAIAELADTLDGHRLTGATRIATTLLERLGTVDPDRLAHVRDSVWTFTSPQLWTLLVTQRGWSPERYGEWVRTALLALVAA